MYRGPCYIYEPIAICLTLPHQNQNATYAWNMNADDFEKHGVEMVRYIAQYMRDLPNRCVSSNVDPGYMRNLLPGHAPTKGENFNDIMKDVEDVIMPGVS